MMFRSIAGIYGRCFGIRWTVNGIFNGFSRAISSNNRPGGSGINVFNRKLKRLQKDRAALSPKSDDFDYLRDEIASRLVDRMQDIPRKFPTALDLGCGKGHISKYIKKESIGQLIQCDMSPEMVQRSYSNPEIPTRRLIVDEEFLPFGEGMFDTVLSSASLHWINDLPGVFRQVWSTLKDGGMFLACLPGGQTLFELRCALQLAEVEREGGFGPHVSPFTEMQDLGGLMTQTGFNTITIDYEEIIVNYPSIYELMTDLRGMGENNASWVRKHVLNAETVEQASTIYKEMYGDSDGNIPASFYVLFLIGWKADAVKSKTLQPRSETFSFKDIDKIDSDNK